LDSEYNSNSIGQGFNPNLPKRLARIILIHDRDRFFSKSIPVAEGKVESLLSESGTLNKRIFFSLEILSLVSVKISKLLVYAGVIEVDSNLAIFSRTEINSCSRVNFSCFS
jgi:hypothetical protein